MLPRVVILDRDGVINRDRDDYVKSAAQWEPEKGAIEAIATLRALGCWVGIATNQSGLARGLFSSADLDAMHQKLRGLVRAHGHEINAIAHCFHLPDAGCLCRKPETGLLHQLQTAYGKSFVSRETCMVGDSHKDLLAAAAFGIPAVLVRTGKGRLTEKHQAIKNPVFDSLKHWVDSLT
ncbi:D-glycero-beta-D-manno-heptose 1,7-bisphosphate 7-phosphatase [Litorivicinus lipolyticus]|uniref:D-glycero-beta-D-manno-heptose 1,7-bisphosphate 7-phosphatase n=1 Tax=Litorivicinus lipolyticus TaxID=418701 RepID=UPI003B5B275A